MVPSISAASQGWLADISQLAAPVNKPQDLGKR
jgi:hypothetical protein